MMHHLTFYYFPHIFFKNSVLPCFTGKKVLPVVIPVNHWFGETSKTITLFVVDDAKANDPPDNDFGGVDEDDIGVMVKLPRLKGGLVVIGGGGGKEEFA